MGKPRTPPPTKRARFHENLRSIFDIKGGQPLTPAEPLDLTTLIGERFRHAGIAAVVEERRYPDEVIFVATVAPIHLAEAAKVGNELDAEISSRGVKGFVTVRAERVTSSASVQTSLAYQGVQDPRVTKLAALLTARSRTSETLPSLSYIPDAHHNISTVMAGRHHLIFGRRGAGKTALLLEARRRVEERGDLSVWVNVQTFRRETASRIAALVFIKLCESVSLYFSGKVEAPSILVESQKITADLQRILDADDAKSAQIERYVPRMNSTLKRFLSIVSHDLFIFLDDFHYVSRQSQPEVLDMIHGAVRDTTGWLKVATIRHLSRWFESNPPRGLETGHDAEVVDLDLTLENPARARDFLYRLAQSFAGPTSLESIDQVFSYDAVDRLVLASGAVPRDFLTLCASSLASARQRPNARQVGVQDVNRAAGEAKKLKLNEVEEDLAAAGEMRTLVPDLLGNIRSFCLEEQRTTFFRIDFHEKEKRATEYGLLQTLLDLRLLHLVYPSLSDEREAGRRSEVFLLDLSQYSGERLKKNLSVLDLRRGQLVLRRTGTNEPGKVADEPKKLLGILRRGPLFSLMRLSAFVKPSSNKAE